MLFFAGHAKAGASAYIPHETYFDKRVDALSARALVRMPPQRLVDPSRQHASHTIVDLSQGTRAVWAFAQILAFWWLWQSGRSARLRDRLRRRFRRRIASRAAFGAALGILAPLAGLPFAFVNYRIFFNVGLTEERIGPWLVHYVFAMAAGAVAAAIVTVVVLELVDRTRLWYIAFTAFLYAAVLGVVAVEPIVFSPIVTQMTPTAIAASAPVEIARSSIRTRTITARTAGIGPTTRILVGDVLMAETSPAEQRYAIARESVHAERGDIFWYTLVATTLLVFAAAFGVLVADRIPFRRDDDPVSRLALVGATTGLFAMLLFPLFSAYARGVESRADLVALQRTNDLPAAVRFFVRRDDDDLVPICNRRSTSWYFALNAASGTRIAALRNTPDPCPK